MANPILSDIVTTVQDSLVLLEAAERVKNPALKLELITSAHARLKVSSDQTSRLMQQIKTEAGK